MKNLFHNWHSLFSTKDCIIWFLSSFSGTLIVSLTALKKSWSFETGFESFIYAMIFVLLMVGTKIYGNFSNTYFKTIIKQQRKKERSQIFKD